jgi:hypothetical protein
MRRWFSFVFVLGFSHLSFYWFFGNDLLLSLHPSCVPSPMFCCLPSRPVYIRQALSLSLLTSSSRVVYTTFTLLFPAPLCSLFPSLPLPHYSMFPCARLWCFTVEVINLETLAIPSCAYIVLAQ